MTQTNLQRRESYYKRIIEDAKNSPHAKHYRAVCDAVAEVVKVSDKLKGSDRIMKPEEFAELKTKYEEAIAKCNEYFQKENDFTDFEKDRKPIIEEISNVLDKDMNALRGYDPNSLETLSQVIKKARTHTVILNRDDLTTVGGALSARIPLKSANRRKGFFTENKIFNNDSKWKSIIEDFESEFTSKSEKELPPKFKACLELLKTDDELRAKIGQMLPNIPINPIYRGTPEVDKELLIPLAKELGLGDDEETISMLLTENESAPKDALFDFVQSIIPIAFQEKFMALAGIKKNTNISNRNCAMSDMARLMGCGKLLASAEPMEIIIGDEIVEGVFMETADGSDLNRLKEDDPLYDADVMSVENPEFLQQVADIQVLDFICGNIDRHKGNMIYQLDPVEGKAPVFTGIKGIDNDCAFGTPEITEGKQIARLVNPESMQFMTAAMATKVKELDRSMMKLVLKKNSITDAEIDAAWDRVEKVRDALEKEKIQILKKEDWNNFKLMTKRTKAGNYFSNIKDMQESFMKDKYKEKRDEVKRMGDLAKDKPIEYVKDQYDIAAVLISKQDKIAELREQMEASRSIFFNSSEYNSMKKNFEKVEALTNQLAEKRENNEKIKDEDLEKVTDAYTALAKKTARYIDLKKLLPKWDNGKLRRKFATTLLEFAHDTMDEVEAEFDKENNEPEKVTEEQEREK